MMRSVMGRQGGGGAGRAGRAGRAGQGGAGRGRAAGRAAERAEREREGEQHCISQRQAHDAEKAAQSQRQAEPEPGQCEPSASPGQPARQTDRHAQQHGSTAAQAQAHRPCFVFRVSTSSLDTCAVTAFGSFDQWLALPRSSPFPRSARSHFFIPNIINPCTRLLPSPCSPYSPHCPTAPLPPLPSPRAPSPPDRPLVCFLFVFFRLCSRRAAVSRVNPKLTAPSSHSPLQTPTERSPFRLLSRSFSLFRSPRRLGRSWNRLEFHS